MTKTILILAIAAAFVAGSIATGTIAFADDDDDDLSQLACEAGKAMTGILFEDDDEITDILCGAQLQGPEGPQGEQGPSGQDADVSLIFANATTYVKSSNFPFTVVGPGRTGFSSAECDVGDLATGGHYSVLFATNPGADYNKFSEGVGESSYSAGIKNTGSVNLELLAQVVCLDNPIPLLTP